MINHMRGFLLCCEDCGKPFQAHYGMNKAEGSSERILFTCEGCGTGIRLIFTSIRVDKIGVEGRTLVDPE